MTGTRSREIFLQYESGQEIAEAEKERVRDTVYK